MVRSSDTVPPLGTPVTGWTPPAAPPHDAMQGRFAVLEPLTPEAHAADLYRSYAGHDQVWDYLPYGPFPTQAAYRAWVETVAKQPDPQFYAIRDRAGGGWAGVASYLRITPQSGSIEVGHINFGPALQATPAATEAMYLMMRRAFETGYRRYEWKCDALNLPSRRAAQRLGFSYEGVFRQATVVKERNRDTAWFAVIDGEWPALRRAFEAWLAPGNFETGRQVHSLRAFTAPLRVSSDPALTDG